MASARVLEKLGFVREGTLREDCVVNGDVSDSWVYGLIRREWRPSSEPVPARRVLALLRDVARHPGGASLRRVEGVGLTTGGPRRRIRFAETSLLPARTLRSPVPITRLTAYGSEVLAPQ